MGGGWPGPIAAVFEEKSGDERRREAASFEEAATTGQLLRLDRAIRTETLGVSGGDPLEPLVTVEIEMGVDQVVRQTLAAELLAHPERAEALAQALGDIELGQPCFAEQALAGQLVEQARDRLGREAALCQLPMQLQAAVLSAREQTDRGAPQLWVQDQTSAGSRGSASAAG